MAKEVTIPENPGLSTSRADCAAAHEKIGEAISQLVFLRHSLEAGLCTAEDVKTILTLYRYCFNDLSSLLDGGETLSAALEESNRMLRTANARIAELEQSIGQSASAEAVLEGFNAICNAFDTWWALSGFHYAQTEYTARGVVASFSDEIKSWVADDMSRALSIVFGDKQLAMLIAPYVSQLFQSGWQTHTDGHRISLTDCDENRRHLKDVFQETYPNAILQEFSSHRDKDSFLLRFKVFVPFADIAAWRTACLEKARKKGTLRTGRIYLERNELLYKLNNKMWRKYTADSVVKASQQTLDRDLVLIKQYESILAAGTPEEQAERLHAFAKENCLDIKADLEGTLYG